jgi:nucleoside-diphosphate-sugar epimerase
MRILITGSQGFIGHHLYKYLRNKGHEVFGMDLVDNGYYQNFWKIDLLSDDLRYVYISRPNEKFDIVFHLASDVGGANYLKNKEYQVMANNSQIDTRIITYAREYAKKLVYFSSSCVYDENGYGKEKMFAEELIKASGIDYLIVRPQNVYGIEDNKGGDREQVIMALFRKAMNDKVIKLIGSGNDKRSFIHYDDLFNQIMKNLKYKNKTIDAGGEWISIKGLAKKISKICKVNKNIMCKTNETKKKYIKFNKGKSLNEGLTEVYKWLLIQ